MDKELYNKIKSLEEKIDKVQGAVNSTKKIFIITLIINVVLFVLPLIGLLIMLPYLFNTLSSVYTGF